MKNVLQAAENQRKNISSFWRALKNFFTTFSASGFEWDIKPYRIRAASLQIKQFMAGK